LGAVTLEEAQDFDAAQGREDRLMGGKPKPVTVRVNTHPWISGHDVVFSFDGKVFRTDRLFNTKEAAQMLADKLQAIFDKGQA
jgi:hypothetical protein